MVQLKRIIEEEVIREEIESIFEEQAMAGATAKDNRKYWTSASAKLQNIIRTIYSTLNDKGERAQFLQQANDTINREFRVLAAQWKKGEREDDLNPEQEQAMQAAEKSSSSKPRETAAQEMGVSTQDLENINQKFKTSLEEQEINKRLVRKMKAAKLAAREWIERQKEAWRHEKKTTADMSKLIYKQFPVLGQDNAMRLAKGEALVTEEELETLNEELTKTDKDDIKKMISKELDKVLKKEIKDVLEDELSKALKSKATKEEIAEITKKVMKKLYKDLSYHHPYIIDRIKV